LKNPFNLLFLIFHLNNQYPFQKEDVDIANILRSGLAVVLFFIIAVFQKAIEQKTD